MAIPTEPVGRPFPFPPYDDGDGSTFSWFESILSRLAGSMDILRFDPPLVFCTRKLDEEVVEGVGVGLGSSGEVAGLVSSLSALDCGVVLFEVPQPHVCLLGMAAVTVPQLHGFDAGCGHELSGRPGFRTGTMSRSLAWVHLVERWPRMQGSLRFA